MKDAPEELIGYIKAAKILGTDILRLWCGTKGSKDMTAEDLEKLYADCRKAADIAEEYGVKLTKSNGDIYYELSFHDDFLYEQSNEFDKEREFKLKH